MIFGYISVMRHGVRRRGWPLSKWAAFFCYALGFVMGALIVFVATR